MLVASQAFSVILCADVLQAQESGFLILILIDTSWSESFYNASRIGLWNHCSWNASPVVTWEPPEKAQRVPQSVAGLEGIGSSIIVFQWNNHKGSLIYHLWALRFSLVDGPSPWAWHVSELPCLGRSWINKYLLINREVSGLLTGLDMTVEVLKLPWSLRVIRKKKKRPKQPTNMVSGILNEAKFQNEELLENGVRSLIPW